MGLSRSLSTGASSLKSQQERFDVISNNLANVNTTGFKSSNVNFIDQFSQTSFYGSSAESMNGLGGTNPIQVGLGVSVGSISTDLTQGDIETTTNALDMAIQGEGYFIYSYNNNQLYSRAGTITRDDSGNLVDSSSGAYLQGYNVEKDANGKIVTNADGSNILSSKLSNLVIDSDTISPPSQTENVSVTGNLNSASETDDTRSTSILIYDTLGNAHSLELTFTKTANANEFSLAATIDDNSVALSSSTVTFNSDGTINTPTNLTLKSADLNTAIGSALFDATKDVAIDNSKMTMYSSTTTATASEQDGYASGSLSSLSVDTQGQIWGAFSNGQSELLGQVAIAKFTNPGGLVKTGENFFTVGVNSGIANIGTAGETFPSSSIASSSLESSNVDMTTEFVNMISTQRAFEAASRIVTVTDEMLQTITQLKR